MHRFLRKTTVYARDKMKKLATFVILLLSVNSILLALAYLPINEATPNIEITPKITIRGPKGKGNKGKPTKQVATGTLGEPPPKDKWAVIIGISDYAGTENDIYYADDDALEMLRTLIEVYNYSRDHILLLISDYTVNNATHDDIIAAIEWLRDNEGPGDEVVFFYSGHGARGLKADDDPEAIDEGIVPWECAGEYIIWDGELASMFSDFDTTRIIFIFDCCYAGGMTDLEAEKRIVVMATTENGVAYESSTLENGVFTYYFVEEGMLQGLADVYDHDGDSDLPEPDDVTIEEAFDYAKPLVKEAVSQTPTISDSFKDDLLL